MVACIVLDAHLPPSLAVWIAANFGIDSFSLKHLNLREATDEEIFAECRLRNAVIITKDIDFLHLQARLGVPPKVIWLTCGNTSKNRLKEIFTQHLPQALELLIEMDLVEITG